MYYIFMQNLKKNLQIIYDIQKSIKYSKYSSLLY